MKLIYVISMLCLLFTMRVRSDPTQEAIEVIEGILVGAFGDIGHEVQTCIKDGEEIFKDVEEAVKDFEAGGLDNIVAGLVKIGEALSLLPEEVKDCEAIPDLIKDIEKIAEEFLNPEELIVQIGKEILWHGVSIYHDVTDCVSQFKAGEYEPAGEDIGDIIKILFLELKLGDEVEDARDFLEGFFKGALEDDSADINDCITDATDVIEQLETIIEDVKSGVTSDVEQLFLDFIDLITDSVKSVAQCEKAPAEIEIMLEWADEMRDISKMENKLFQAFLYYPDRLKEDLKTVIDSFEDHSYSTSGFCLGDVLHVLFKDISAPKVGEDYFDDAVEFLTAFYSKAFNIDVGLETCEADVEAEWAQIKKAIDELEKLSIESIKEGVEDFIKAVPMFVNAFQECESDWPQLEKGLEEMHIFIEDATKIPVAVSKAVTLHFIRVEGDCSEMYHAFHDTPHDFKKGGDGSGDLTALLISELEQPMIGSLLKKLD